MPVRPVKVGETKIDKRNRMVIPTDLRKVLGVESGETYEILRIEGSLDIFGESIYLGVPKSRERGLLIISYAPVTKDEAISTVQTWSNNYPKIKALLEPGSDKQES